MARKLADEVGKHQPFRSREQEAFLNLMRTGQQFEGDFKTLFRRFDLSPTAYNLLRILRGHRPIGCRCSTIRDELVVRVPDVTRLVNRLFEMDLVSRAPDPDDARAVLIRITPQGLRRLEQLDDLVMELHERQLGHFTPNELETLIDLLERARDAAPDR